MSIIIYETQPQHVNLGKKGCDVTVIIGVSPNFFYGNAFALGSKKTKVRMLD